MNNRRAFTLIELLTVMMIIAVLMGLIVGVGKSARDRAKKTKAAAMISGLESALGMYYSDMGTYPASTDDTTPLVNALDYATGQSTNWHGPYMEFDAADLDGTIPTAKIKDPWNHDFHYKAIPSSHNLSSFDIWSNGPDGTDNNGGGDDITNW